MGDFNLGIRNSSLQVFMLHYDLIISEANTCYKLILRFSKFVYVQAQ